MIQGIISEISEVFSSYNPDPIVTIDRLPQSGGDRMYFRLITATQSFIATYNLNLKENQAFIYLTDHFRKHDCPVTEIFKINSPQTIYIQKDLGDSSLLYILERKGYSDYCFQLFKKSLKALAKLQIKGGSDLNYIYAITSKEFGKQGIMSDLLYFKYYFLDTLKIPYDKDRLLNDFNMFSGHLDKADYKYFMYRDFQSRNIMIQNDEVHFIDYQGGMKGALQYDVASLLWQAKAELSDEWKDCLLEYYIDCVEEISNSKIERKSFRELYHGYVLIRLLQVLGAYGFRGLFERKAHFLTSIPLALKNLRTFLEKRDTGVVLPEFNRVLFQITETEIISRFENVRANKSTKLIVKVNSFSFKIGGIPKDETENGGGFVFDCRGILNPGRFDAYKKVNGRDRAVMEFLEQNTKMPEFLNNVYNILDISVQDYITRDFESLIISFGCTGGCHRSVYAAEAVTRYLRNKYNVKVILNHIEQNITEKKGF